MEATIDQEAIRHQLERLATARAEMARVQTERNDRRNAVLAKIADELEAIDSYYVDDLSEREHDVAETEHYVKTAVLMFGGTVKGTGLMAVYAKGRTSWDGKRLDGYAAAHPEILAFRSEGQPSVSIREV